ncbi:18916_t:CDS:2, partial [Gigaspora rosea]
DEPHHSDNELAYSNNFDYKHLDNNAWFPTGEMQIKYEASSMNKRIWKLISLQAKETDKLLAKVAYHFSAILRLFDNLLRAIYNTKPDNNDEALMAWEYIEIVLKDMKSLLLDSLLYTNEFQKQ